MRPTFLALLFLSLSAFAATPYQVVDLKGVSDSTATSTPRFIGTVNGIGLFLATVGNTTAVWRTDGTSTGTYVLKPIYGVSYFGGFVSNGNTAWFSAAEATGWAMWRTDGSTTTTITANNSKTIVMLAAIGEKAFFVSASAELWATNGNSVLSLTLLTPVLGSRLSAAVLGNRLFLGTDSGLWKTDGTVNGTTKIGNNPAYALTFANGRLFYGARTFDTGAELWVSDGNGAGHLVVDYTPGPNPTFEANSVMEGIGDRVVFIAGNGDLVSSDGTESGTSRLSTGPAPNFSSTFVSFNGSLYFPYSNALWRTDGTAAGTSAVADGKISGLTRTESRLYYVGSSPQHPLALFSHDGTSATFIADVSISIFAVADDHKLFFAGNDPYHGVEPWVTDGTPAGAHLIANLATDPAGSSRPRQFVAGADRLYFVADGDSGSDLWSTDGSPAGTTSLVHADQSNSLPVMIAPLGSWLYLRRGAKLTKIDESGNETTVQDFSSGNGGLLDGSVIDGRLYLRAGNSSTTNLFTTDGTSAGTVSLTDFHFDGPMPAIASAGLPFLATKTGIAVAAGPTPQATRAFARATPSVSAQSNLLPFAGAFLLFTEGFNEGRLWKFSGGANDATTVKVMPSGHFVANAGAAGFGATLLFAWRSGAGPIQLWKTDGTAEGTLQIKQFTNTFSGDLVPFAVLGNRVLFALYDGPAFTPWVSDGTAEGTKSLAAITLTGNAATFRYFIADGLAYFAANSGLWQTDGTVEGTKAISGVTGVTNAGIARLGNTLYFAATTSEQGTELWAFPLPGPGAVTIDDVRTSEAGGSATVTVRLTQASNQRVTVAYETADGSAKAGHDYTAASGTLDFETGELAKTITIALANDSAPGTARAFLVKLKDANVAIEKTWGSVAIEDDDNAADLEVIFYPPSGARFDVRNNGPSAASNVIFCSDVRGFGASHRCEPPVELASGETRSYSVSDGGTVISGSVTAWERDPISVNNASVWSSTNGILFVSTGALRPGEQGVAAIHRSSNQSVTFTSSDPAIIRFPDNVTTSADQSVVWATFTALASGTATLRVEYAGFTYGAVVQVIETPRLPVIVLVNPSLSQLRFGQPSEIAATVSGITPDGVRPSGSVSFFQDGIPIGTASRFDQTARIYPRDLQPGAHRYTATYSGDSRFAAGTSEPLNMTVAKAFVSFGAITTDGSNVVIVLRGVDGYVPSGTITVLEDGSITRPVGALSPLGSGSASATATGFSSTARTVAISYSGDARYETTSVTIPISGVHRHATRR